MAKALSYSFIILYLVALVEPVAPILSYQLDNSEFAELCINKLKGNDECQGKCHLQKQINEHSDLNNEAIPEIDFSKFPYAITLKIKDSFKRNHILTHQTHYLVKSSQFIGYLEPNPPKI